MYEGRAEARAAGAAPVRRGRPGYSRNLDRDDDGIACDTRPELVNW
ncbi:excalibur calcium-binding domain-containing protein [Streptomyces sp. NPDC059650]